VKSHKNKLRKTDLTVFTYKQICCSSWF